MRKMRAHLARGKGKGKKTTKKMIHHGSENGGSGKIAKESGKKKG